MPVKKAAAKPVKKAAAKPVKEAAAKPTEAPSDEVVVTVSGLCSVDGVKPGRRLAWDGNLARLRDLMAGGYVTVTVGGEKIGDGHIVARMEGA